MVEILDKKNCCGCEACVNICPSNCIQMEPDDWGFYYPKIDAQKCIKCNKCERVCPFINQPLTNQLKAYAVQSKDQAILNKCSSGGFFTTLSKYIIANDGYSVGAAYLGDDKIIHHTIVHTLNDITNHSSSKYVQSKIDKIYREVKLLLENKNKVLFSGTPCQVNGFCNFLGKSYDNLYIVDFACAGIASPKIFTEYIKQKELKNGKVNEVNFRYKEYGYHSSTMKLIFDNGKEYSRSRLTDYMMGIFTSYIPMRPSCTNCKAKGLYRSSDITMFECWNYNKLTGKEDNNLGYTNIIINTTKGKELFEKVKNNFYYIDVNMSEAIKIDGNTYNVTVSKHKNVDLFFETFNKEGISATAKKYCNINILSYIKEFTKPILYKFGLLAFIKKIFSKSRC